LVAYLYQVHCQLDRYPDLGAAVASAQRSDQQRAVAAELRRVAPRHLIRSGLFHAPLPVTIVRHDRPGTA
jgi:hypothetical protein